MAKYVGALDQGTTSTRFMIFDHSGGVVGIDQKEHEQIYPKPGWVEHDPAEIWTRSVEVIRGALAKAGIAASDLAAVGITNQRETAVVWDRKTGKAVYNAIVWQDTRTDTIINEWAKDGGQDRFRAKVGLPLATYFSGPKVKWILDNVAGRPRQGGGGRSAVRQHRHLVHLEPDRRRQRRRSRHGRDQCQPYDADEPGHPRLGSGHAQGYGHPAVHAAEHHGLERRVRKSRRRSGRHSGGRRPGRPAGRALRPDVLLARRGEEHVWHRLLHAPQHRHQAGALQERPPDHARLQDRRPACGLRTGRLDRDHRRPGPVAARQPGHDQDLAGDRRSGQDGRRQRRGVLRARLLGPVRSVLEEAMPEASSSA